MKVNDRQTINIGTDLSVAGGNNFYVPIVLRFFPDEMIVRSLSYANGAADTDTAACQVWTNLVDDGVIAGFVSGATYSQNVHSTFQITKKIQNGSFNFQIQFAPTAASTVIQTGPGPLVTFGEVNGELVLILEFLKLG